MLFLFTIPASKSPTGQMMQFKITPDNQALAKPVKHQQAPHKHQQIIKHLKKYPNDAFFFNTKDECIIFGKGLWTNPTLQVSITKDFREVYTLSHFGIKSAHPDGQPARSRFYSRGRTASLPDIEPQDIPLEENMNLHDDGDWLYFSNFTI